MPLSEQLPSLARQGTIRILDVEFVVKDSAGDARKAAVDGLGGAAGPDLSAWVGAWRRDGAPLIADGVMSADDLVSALDAAERP